MQGRPAVRNHHAFYARRASIPSIAILGTILLLSAPLASANGGITMVPPYSGAHAYNKTVGGPAIVPAFTNSTSGRITFEDSVAAVNSSRTVSVTIHAGFWGPPFVIRGPSGARHVSYAWRISWAANGGSDGTGFPVYYNWIILQGNLYDNTSHAWVLPGPAGAPRSASYTISHHGGVGAAPWSGSGVNHRVWVNFTANLTQGHHYLFYALIFVFVRADSGHNSMTGATWSGRSFVDFASGGRGAWLLSMKVQ